MLRLQLAFTIIILETSKQQRYKGIYPEFSLTHKRNLGTDRLNNNRINHIFLIRLILVLIPAAIVAFIVWYFTGSGWWAGVAFLVIAALSMLKKL
jgi:hypothetical protein